MKKYLLALALTIIFSSFVAKGQNIKAFVTLGGNLSQIDGDEVYGFKKLGFTGSIGAMIPIAKENWWVSVETKFAQYGAYERSYPYHYDATLPYIEIPLLIHFEDYIGGWTFGLGASYGRLMKYNEISAWDATGVTTAITDAVKTEYNKNDISFVADIRFKIWKNLKFNFRYQYSLVPIKKDWTFTYLKESWNNDAYNNILSGRLIWVINDKDTTKKKHRKKR